jgi:hypothetical protein
MIARTATKSQLTASYQRLRSFLRALHEEAGLTRREIGRRSCKPQSRVCNFESRDRRVNVTQFVGWAEACLRCEDRFPTFPKVGLRG